MSATTIREKLYNYIRFAEDKKIKAIYTMVEEDINTNYQWWEDKDFMSMISKDANEIKKGKLKTFSLAQVKKDLDTLRKK